MRRWIGLAANLYPQAWREHYGEEFTALLEDVRPGRKEFMDVLRGALKMQMTNASTYLKLVAGAAVVGAIVATAASFALPRVYESTAVMRVAPPQDAQAGVSSKDAIEKDEFTDEVVRQLSQSEQLVLSRTELEGLITQPGLDLYRQARSRLPMEDIVRDMRNHDIRIRMVSDSPGAPGKAGAFTVSFSYPDQRKAQAVVRALVAEFIEQSAIAKRMQERANRVFQETEPQFTPPPSTFGNLEVLDPASLPEKPINRWLPFTVVGLISGLLLGLLATVWMLRPQWTLRMAAFAAGCCALTVAASFLVPNTYRSTAVMQIVPARVSTGLAASSSVPPLSERIQHLERDVVSDASLEGMIQAPPLDLYKQQRARKPIKEIVDTMRTRDLKIQILNQSLARPRVGTAFSISFTYPDQFKAQAVVRAVVTRFVELNVQEARARAKDMPEIARRIEEAKLGENLEVIDPASDPQQPIEPHRVQWAVIGMGVGLLLGAITLHFRRNRTQTLRTA